MCQTAKINDIWNICSSTTAGVLVAGTVAVVALPAAREFTALGIYVAVLWGAWIVINGLMTVLLGAHIMSLPDVCPCTPPRTANRAAFSQLWRAVTLVIFAAAIYAAAFRFVF